VEPYRIADRTHVIPLTLPIPSRGLLYLNPLVILGREPVIVDTGPAMLRQEYLDAVFSVVEPEDVRWIFLSHDDRDHAGNVMLLLDLCRNARLVTNFQARHPAQQGVRAAHGADHLRGQRRGFRRW